MSESRNINEFWSGFDRLANKDKIDKVYLILKINPRTKLEELKGLQLIKTVYYLHDAGCYLPGFEPLINETPEINQIMFGIIKILALELVTPKQATKEIGYCEVSDMFRVILRRRSCSQKVFDLIQKFLEKYKNFQPGSNFEVTIKIGEIDNLVETISTLNKLCLEIDPVLLSFLKNSNQQERSELRKRLEVNGLIAFDFSNYLFWMGQKVGALCSERALKNFLENSKITKTTKN